MYHFLLLFKPKKKKKTYNKNQIGLKKMGNAIREPFVHGAASGGCFRRQQEQGRISFRR
jgi:hypothetical protein